METIEDIVREMRDRNEVRKVRLRQYGGVHCNCSIMPDDLPKVYADRIEKAAAATELGKMYEYAVLWDYDNSLFVKSTDYSYIKQKIDEVNADGFIVCHLVRRSVGEWEEVPNV